MGGGVVAAVYTTAAWKFALTDWVKTVADGGSGRHKLDMALDDLARARQRGGVP